MEQSIRGFFLKKLMIVDFEIQMDILMGMGRKEFLKEAYEVSRLSEREKIDEEYAKIEGVINAFYEDKNTAKEMADQLGSAVLGAEGEHASSQIYAFEVLLKSLAEVDLDARGVSRAIASEALFDAAATSHPIKEVYLLGLLQYYSSKDRLEEINREMTSGKKNAQLEEEAKIIIQVRSAAEYFKKDPLLSSVAQYIIDDFPASIPKCAEAKLIAKYYAAANLSAAADLTGKTPRATEKPGLPEAFGEFTKNKKLRSSLKGSGIPNEFLPLTRGYHPSREKLDEADFWGMDLVPEAALIESVRVSTPQGPKTVQKKTFVEYDCSPKLTRLYLRRIRHYKDKNQLDKVGRLEQAFAERIWRYIEEKHPMVAQKIGKKENMTVIKRTIRDLPSKTQLAGQPASLEQNLERELEELVEFAA